jgi:hypothetical protein
VSFRAVFLFLRLPNGLGTALLGTVRTFFDGAAEPRPCFRAFDHVARGRLHGSDLTTELGPVLSQRHGHH